MPITWDDIVGENEDAGVGALLLLAQMCMVCAVDHVHNDDDCVHNHVYFAHEYVQRWATFAKMQMTCKTHHVDVDDDGSLYLR